MVIQSSHKKAAWLVISLGILAAPLALLAQTASDDIPRLPDGRPDMQGTWDFRTITPFQRPEALADREFLSAEEFAAFEAAELERREGTSGIAEKAGRKAPSP